ncbi:hypothetical protein ACJX0J_019489 [Zea mays]
MKPLHATFPNVISVIIAEAAALCFFKELIFDTREFIDYQASGIIMAHIAAITLSFILAFVRRASKRRAELTLIISISLQMIPYFSTILVSFYDLVHWINALIIHFYRYSE